MYCKFKDGDLVMVTRDTKTYYGSIIRKWIYGTVLTCFAADGRYDGYVRILLGKDNFTLIPIKDLKKISDGKIPKGSYSTPKFNNGDHVVYKGETGSLAIEGRVVDNKPYYNECKIVIRTKSGNHMIVDECNTRTIYEYRYFDTVAIPKHLLNSVYGMSYREFEDCVNDVAVTMNLMKYEQKLKEANNMKNANKILDGRRFITLRKTGDREITATLYDSERTVDNSYINGPVMTASAKCHPEDTFDLDTGCKIALERLEKKWAKQNDGWSNFDKGVFSVRVNKNDIKRFLKMLDEAGYIWMGGQKMFDFVEFFGLTYESDDVWFTANPNHRVAWSDVLVGAKCVSFDEFCKLV